MKVLLAQKLREFRKKQGLTQEQLAEAMGVTVGAVSKWESAASIPDLDKILKLSQLFDVSTDTLLKDEIDLADALPGELPPPSEAPEEAPGAGEYLQCSDDNQGGRIITRWRRTAPWASGAAI